MICVPAEVAEMEGCNIVRHMPVQINILSGASDSYTKYFTIEEAERFMSQLSSSIDAVKELALPGDYYTSCERPW